MSGRIENQGNSLKEVELHIDERGEVIHGGPMAVQQNYENYSEEEHRVWALLYKQQKKSLQKRAYSCWLEAIDRIELCEDRIPSIAKTGALIHEITGWRPVPVEGFLTARDYFGYLSRRQFPTVPSIRERKDLEFMVLPDIFHDAFGHLPMHSDPIFADFLQLFGKTALAIEDEKYEIHMQRLYWFSVEYCLIREKGELRVCGSGHMSGIKEACYSLTDEVEKRPFVLEEVVEQDYNPHVLQPVMFVIDSYDQLFEAMTKKAKEFGVL